MRYPRKRTPAELEALAAFPSAKRNDWKKDRRSRNSTCLEFYL